MRVFWLVTVFVMMGICGRAGEAAAQVGRVAMGGAAGVAGGGVAMLSIVVARARFQGQYLDHFDDLIHWQSAPMLIGPALGVAFGLAGSEPLRDSLVGAGSGMVLGAAAGASLGWLMSDEAEGPWAGGVIGAGIGLTAGGLTLGIRAWLKDDEDRVGAPVRLGVRVPLR